MKNRNDFSPYPYHVWFETIAGNVYDVFVNNPKKWN
jgi:hypothetical protein